MKGRPDRKAGKQITRHISRGNPGVIRGGLYGGSQLVNTQAYMIQTMSIIESTLGEFTHRDRSVATTSEEKQVGE